jgi:hypothetical protein
MTPGGKKWLMDTFGAFIIGVGSIPTLAAKIWDVVQGVYDVAVNGDPEDDEGKPNTASGGNPEVDSNATPADKNSATKKSKLPYNIGFKDLGY